MTTHKMVQAANSVDEGSVGQQTQAMIKIGMQQVEELLFDTVNSDVDVLRDASRHIVQAGGKRIRPRLVLLSYVATGGSDIKNVIPPAAAVELVHTASVVHDDINDKGVVRRGRPSVNSLWGSTFALLTGDYLFTKVYELMAPYKDLNILLSEATIALVEGETLQASAVKDNNFSREVYYKIIARKTAALFKASTVIGATLSNSTTEEIEALGQYGFNIGLAFQIIDDILDLTGDEEQLGKTAGIDTVQGKGIASIHENGQAINDTVDAIKEKMMGGDTIEKGRAYALVLVQTAISSLDILPASPHKDALVEMANLVVNRTS
jgi:geranylgeranyl pyrophosphate synthase